MKDNTFMELANMCLPNNNDVRKDEIKEKLTEIYKTKYVSENETQLAIDQFLQFCSDRTELFVPASQCIQNIFDTIPIYFQATPFLPYIYLLKVTVLKNCLIYEKNNRGIYQINMIDADDYMIIYGELKMFFTPNSSIPMSVILYGIKWFNFKYFNIFFWQKASCP